MTLKTPLIERAGFIEDAMGNDLVEACPGTSIRDLADIAHAVNAHAGLVEALRHALTRDHAHAWWCDGCTRAHAALAAAERKETT